jgi:FkbM family methyltransferase
MKYRFDLQEVVVISAVLVLMTATVALQYEPPQIRRAAVLAADGVNELAALEQIYGPVRHTLNAEEWIIRDFFRDKRDGTFLDLGANDYRNGNNTYFLETVLGWHGLAVDAQQEFAAGYQQHRSRTKFLALFVSDVTGSTTDLYVPRANSLTASSNRAFAEAEDGVTVARAVATMTLNDLLARERVDRVDFVSMDVELAEPKALAGFDVERFAPALLCVEAHSAVRQDILDYFARHHYVVVGKYLRMDTQNLYFMPASGVR